ncbi:UPF0136 membrane protein P14E8.05c [Mycena venus]|uniref:UPF0136 membrane protein P14E8.05c n=1 Tax=Mycena venus TaxID=2733690 RepID=A0A8H7CZC1_9AGAR|nr:UPF0136 membrane protein P14E8.05c [Mycena venus]
MSLMCIVGGSTAFYKKSSIPSLVAGLMYGLCLTPHITILTQHACTSDRVGMLYLWSGTQIGEGNPKGLQGAFLASALLTLSSLPRVAKGPVPKLLATSSAVVGFYYGRQLYY